MKTAHAVLDRNPGGKIDETFPEIRLEQGVDGRPPLERRLDVVSYVINFDRRKCVYGRCGRVPFQLGKHRGHVLVSHLDFRLRVEIEKISIGENLDEIGLRQQPKMNRKA